MNNKNWLKICSLVLALMLCLTSFGTLVFADEEVAETRTVDAWDGTADTSFLTGENEGKTSYVIDTAEKLAGLAYAVDNAWAATDDAETTDVNEIVTVGSYAGVTFYITADIDLDGHEWNPIGNHNASAFGGNLVGCYGDASCQHTYNAETGVSSCASVKISNMSITAAGNYEGENKGLIARKTSGSVMNITMVNPYIETTAQSTGPIVGYSPDKATTYANLRVEGGSIKADNGTSGRTAGLVGYINIADTVINCYSEMVVTVSKASAAIGGITGQGVNAIQFVNCETKFTVLNPGLFALNKVGGISGGGNAGTGATFKNCTANVDITGGANAAKDGTEMIIGGINGFASGSGTQTYMNCTTTGKITIDGDITDGTKIPGTRVGGIAGVTQNTVNFTNCVSTIDFTYKNIGNNNLHCGGIAGQISDGKNATATNCYYGGTINASAGKRIGGFFGYMGGNLTMTDCQMDGIVNSSATQNGTVIGRWDLRENTISMTNVIVTGIGASTYANAYAWIGTAANYNKTATFTATNCFSNANIPFIGSNDCDANAGTTNEETGETNTNYNSTVTINGTPVEGTAIGAYASYKPSQISKVLLWTSLDSQLWDTTSGIPVLKVAPEVRPFAGADLSWFDPASATKEYTVADKADALGVAMLGQLKAASELGYTFTVTQENVDVLTAAKKQAGVGFGVLDGAIAISNNGETVMNDTLAVKYQLNENDANAIRLIGSVNGEDLSQYTQVGFMLTYGEKSAKLYTTTVYQTITADEASVAVKDLYGANSDYFFAVNLTNVPTEAVFTVQAFVVDNGTTLVGEVYTFCLADLA